MPRNLLRLAALVFVLSTTFALTLPRPALAISCGTGSYYINCSRKCCGGGMTTTYYRTGVANSCNAARSACASCLPACPSGQTVCSSITYGVCGF